MGMGTGDDEADGAFRVPTAPKPGAVLGAVKDKPFGRAMRVLDRPCARRQFRCAGRDEETAASRTRKLPQLNPATRAA